MACPAITRLYVTSRERRLFSRRRTAASLRAGGNVVASAVPKLAGPLAIALAGMDAEVRDAIAERAMQSGAKAAGAEGGELVFEGSVLIGSGRKARP
jgi:hypothetical protein